VSPSSPRILLSRVVSVASVRELYITTLPYSLSLAFYPHRPLYALLRLK
jgi:hypothetical protein